MSIKSEQNKLKHIMVGKRTVKVHRVLVTPESMLGLSLRYSGVLKS